MTVDGTTPLNALVQPGPLGGEVRAIASKSAAHRMLICAALADAPTDITCATTSQDIEATCDCLRALGAQIAREGDVLHVSPIPARQNAGAPARLDCGESGSTLRFMLPVVCALGCAATLDGHGRLPERPLEPLRARLNEHGGGVSGDGVWPVGVAAGGLSGGYYDLPGNVSSQYVTGLLLALPLTGEGGCVRLHGVVESRPYIDMTVSALRAFGVEVVEDSEFVCGEVDGVELCERCATFAVAPEARYASPGCVTVEGDWSNAAFWLCAGALSTEPVTVTGLDLASDQGDMRVLDVLGDFGAYVRVHPGSGWATVCGHNPETGEACRLHGTTVDARDVPDLVPVLSVVAACAEGQTHVVNAARLRIKESDRLQTTSEILCSLGVMVEELPDGLVIHGRGGAHVPHACLNGCAVRAHGDHRIAMTASVAAARTAAPVVVYGAQAVAKSYPGFFDDLALLGGSAQLEPADVQRRG